MEFWLAQTLNGLSFGALLFLLASGLSLIFGLMRIVNIAHGSYYLLGTYIALSVVKATHSFILALLAAAAGVAAIGFIMQRVFLARFYRQTLAQVLLTMGFSFVFADVTLLVWGGDPQRLSTPALLARSVAIGPVYFPAYRAFVIVVGAAVAFFGAYPGADSDVLPLAFDVVIIGGLGSLKGAVVGSAVVGILDNFGKALFPELSYFTLFVPMAIILAVRPTGLFGRA